METALDAILVALQKLNDYKNSGMGKAHMAAGQKTADILFKNPVEFGKKAGSDMAQIYEMAKLASEGNGAPQLQLQPNKLNEVIDQLKRVGQTGSFIAGVGTPVSIPIASGFGMASDYAVNGTRGINNIARNALEYLPEATQAGGLATLGTKLLPKPISKYLRLDQNPDMRYLVNR